MFSFNKRKTIITSTLIISSTIVMFAFTPAQQQQGLKNIKTLPSTMTYHEVDSLMDEYKVALGVKCNYCHAPQKDNPRRMDPASDENPRKEIARSMIRMTMEMNKKYISLLPHSDTNKVQLVTCNTCHRGVPVPFGQPVQQRTPAPPNTK